MKEKTEGLDVDIINESLTKINSLQKLEPEYIASWLAGLTELEQKIVSAIYQRNRAVSIGEVMAMFTINTLYANINLTKHPEWSFPFISYYYIDLKLVAELKKINDVEEQIIKLKESFTFPSFRRINASMTDLVSMGILFTRKENLENEKIKGLYYLNPALRTQINRLKK